MLATKLTDTPETTDLSIHTKQADETFQTTRTMWMTNVSLPLTGEYSGPVKPTHTPDWDSSEQNQTIDYQEFTSYL